MKWTIHNRKFDGTSLMVDTEFDPKNDILRYFFAQIKPSQFVELISYTIKSMGFGVELASVRFFKEMDWEDKEGLEISEGDVNVYHQVFGDTIIRESLFDRILYDYGLKLLEVHGASPNLPDNWTGDMKEGLACLEEKIKGLT